MPSFEMFTKRQLDYVLPKIGDMVYTIIGSLQIEAWRTPEPVRFEQRHSGRRFSLAVGEKWGDLFDCAWFHFTGTIPDAAAGQKVVLLLDVNGELCVVDEQGVPVRGLTNVASWYDFSLGKPGKRVLQVTDRAQGGERIDVWADAGCNDLFGNLQGNGQVVEASMAICDDQARALYYDWEVLLDFLGVLPEDTARHQQVWTALNDAFHILVGSAPDRVSQAQAALAAVLNQQGGDPTLRVSAIGHAHMDLAWLWPIRETIRKGARTFATALDLMEHYPDYVFGASQPQLYQWMKEYYPALYERIKAHVAEGRIEPQGAMWVEADTNLSGGEALARQILMGKRFFRQEFGVQIKALWLPDVFGYSAALPQILKKAGVDYFMTQKLSWSLINAFPHQSFYWQGIDGSTVLTHMLPEETYNSPAAPRSLAKIERNYRDKGVSTRCLMLFGIGDGGGGPGEEHLERLARLRDLSGLAPVRQEQAAAFFAKWAMDAPRFPTWVGELYLERHQGTLTTEARNKWYNRRMELALRELEWIAAISGVSAQTAYPVQRLSELWREVLLYQFHDILPGSSIKRVYDESCARYAQMLREVQAMTAEQAQASYARIGTVGMREPVVVRNSLSWERKEWIACPSHGPAEHKWQQVAVPSMGYATVDAAGGPAIPTVWAAEELLENDLLRVRFDAGGAIISIYDKQAEREVLPAGETGNQLLVYTDYGDAWDFAMDYAASTPRRLQLLSSEARLDGPQAVLKQVYGIGSSRVTQEIALMDGSRRLDFRSSARWRETESMLRVRFPVDIHAEEATFEIQFGSVRRPTHRNTTWDLAKDEVPAQKWADLSQRDYGVALLNDSKYGYKVKGQVIELALLRSVPYPGPRLVADEQVAPDEPHHAFTDQCDHLFTYALLPHLGDHIVGGVVQAAYELNVPLNVTVIDQHEGPEPLVRSFVQVDVPNVIVEAVKRAEEGDDLIVRLYECAHQGVLGVVWFGFPVRAAEECNLLEEVVAPLECQGNSVRLAFRPFEIKTLRVTPA
jgi:alpha-mannosidase